MYTKVLFNGDEDKAKEYQEGLAGIQKWQIIYFLPVDFKEERTGL